MVFSHIFHLFAWYHMNTILYAILYAILYQILHYLCRCLCKIVSVCQWLPLIRSELNLWKTLLVKYPLSHQLHSWYNLTQGHFTRLFNTFELISARHMPHICIKDSELERICQAYASPKTISLAWKVLRLTYAWHMSDIQHLVSYARHMPDICPTYAISHRLS